MPEKIEIDWNITGVIREFAQLRDQLGSTGGTAQTLSNLGGAFGISDIRSAAEALHRASLSGLGRMTAAEFGIPYRPFEIGDATDRGQMLIQALEGLRDVSRSEGRPAAIAAARNLNIEDWIGVINLTAEQFSRIKQEAMATKDIYSPERIANATMLNNEVARFNRYMDDLRVSIGSFFVPIGEGILGWVNDRIAQLRGEETSSQGTGAGLGTSMENLRSSVDQNTEQLRRMQGFYGGGARARSAVPAAFGLGVGLGQYIADNLRSLSKSLGSSSMNS